MGLRAGRGGFGVGATAADAEAVTVVLGCVGRCAAVEAAEEELGVGGGAGSRFFFGRSWRCVWPEAASAAACASGGRFG